MRTNMTLALQRLVYSSITPTNSPAILHDNPQRESHKPHDPPTLVTWLNLLRNQTNTGISAALNTQKHADQGAHVLAHSPNMWHQSMLANVTRNWSWRLYGINHAIRTSSAIFQQKQTKYFQTYNHTDRHDCSNTRLYVRFEFRTYQNKRWHK